MEYMVYKRTDCEGIVVYMKSHRSIWKLARGIDGMEMVQDNLSSIDASNMRSELDFAQTQINRLNRDIKQILEDYGR